MADGWFNAAGLRAAYTLVFGTKTIFIPKIALVDSAGMAVTPATSAQFPASLGQKTAAGSLSVVLASDSNPSSIYTDQQALTASAVALTARALVNGAVLTAKSTNAGNIFIGFDNTVTTADDGTGSGYRLLPGQSISFGVTNASAIWIIGTLNDVIYVAGN